MPVWTSAKKKYDEARKLHTEGLASQEKSLSQQLDAITHKAKKPVVFTLIDKSYGGMLIEGRQMVRDVVGIDTMIFVTLDSDTFINACRLKLNVVYIPFWEDNSVRKPNRIAHAKFVTSAVLSDLGVEYYFTEMDIWFIHSPQFIPKLYPDVGIILSAHTNNPMYPNIGFYFVRPSKEMSKFFRISTERCLSDQKSFDQLILPCFLFGDRSDTGMCDPKITKPLNIKYHVLDPHWFAVSHSPMVVPTTIAMHTLTSKPLTQSTAKISLAKEFYMWFGADGYYKHTKTATKIPKYITYDGVLSESYLSGYHTVPYIQFKLAFLVAAAYFLDRILILPPLFDGEMHHYWPAEFIDVLSVNRWVQTREATFLSNPKLNPPEWDPVVRVMMQTNEIIDEGIHGNRVDSSHEEPNIGINVLKGTTSSMQYYQWTKEQWTEFKTTVQPNDPPADWSALMRLLANHPETKDAPLIQVQLNNFEPPREQLSQRGNGWFAKMMREVLFCEQAIQRHPLAPEADWDCISKGGHIFQGFGR